MKYRLGIDLGTSSIGVVALELDKSGMLRSCPWHAVRIFAEPLEKGQAGLKPKKAGRREARLQRKQLERRARRIRRVAYLADLLGLNRQVIPPHPGPGFVELRARAARERVDLRDLLRILLRLAKRRGYRGEFKNSKDPEASVMKLGAENLAAEMANLARQRHVEHVTLGEYLAYRHHTLKLPTRLKLSRQDVPDLFALRGMVEAEFDQIWSTQSKFHPILTETHKGTPIREHFREAIFHQRPLKSPAPMVGRCPLEPSLPRAPRAQPTAQAFRIEKTIGDLRWGMGRRATPLSPKQREVIRHVLNDPDRLRADGTVTFKSLYKELVDAGCPRPEGRGLNLERASREELKGNTTLVAFKRLALFDFWTQLGPRTQIQAINFLADLGSPEQLDRDDWHQQILKAGATPNDKNPYREFNNEFIGYIERLRASEKLDRLSKMGFEGGRSAYSVKALNRLVEWLRGPAWDEEPGSQTQVDEDSAIRQCYPDRFATTAMATRLPEPQATGNDVVDVALHQLHFVINQCLDTLGKPPSEIIVEMSRELGAGAQRRNEWEMRSAANNQKRRKAATSIEHAGATATSTKILRFLLWEEQEHSCPYCEQKLGLDDALDGSQTHIEHIFPRSLTRVGRKRSELVISHATCNNLKADRTPYQAFGHDDRRWSQIEGHATRFIELGKNNYGKDRPLAMAYFRKARLLTAKDYAREVLTDESINSFADRQLHQSSWIAKAASAWLSTICPNVFASRGEMTAGLRGAWRLDTVIPEVRYEEGYTVLDTEGKPIAKEDFERFREQWEGKALPGATNLTDRRLDKRIDHRHHLIDALTIAQTSRALYQRIARKYMAETETISRGSKSRRDWMVEPPLSDIRDIALALVRNCNLSHKPNHHPNGKFFRDTVYGVADGPDEGRRLLTLKCRVLDLVDEKSEEKTRCNIETIVSDEVRGIVLDAFDRRTKNGATTKEALSKPISYPRYRTTIEKVRCFQRQGRGFLSADRALIIEHRSRAGHHLKRLVPDGYACLDVTNGTKRPRVELIPVPAFLANRKKSHSTLRFYKGDTVLDKTDGNRYIIHQFNTAGGGCIIVAPITETRPITQLTLADGRRKIAGKNLLRLEVIS